MISVKAILDEKNLTLLEKIDIKGPCEVIVTLLDKKDEVEFWSKAEIEKMGQTVFMVKDIDNEG